MSNLANFVVAWGITLLFSIMALISVILERDFDFKGALMGILLMSIAMLMIGWKLIKEIKPWKPKSQ